jgi:hypothetical protein
MTSMSAWKKCIVLVVIIFVVMLEFQHEVLLAPLLQSETHKNSTRIREEFLPVEHENETHDIVGPTQLQE